MITEYSGQAIQSVLNGQKGFCKFLSANDTGATGAHQAGIYIPNHLLIFCFQNQDKKVKIRISG